MKNLFAGKGVVGWTSVDVEADGLCGVTVLAPQTPGGKPRVVKCGFIPGGKLDVQTLTELSKKISVPGCPWTLTLSRKTYNILVVPEPNVQSGELDQSVRWSISNMIDYPMDEASMAYMQIPTSKLLPNRPSNLYVAVTKKEVIAGYNAIFQQAGIQLQAIDIRETAQRNIAARVESPGKGLGLLSICKLGVQFIVTFNGSLYLDRFVEENLFSSIPHEAVADERASERIALQVQRSLDFIGRTLTFIDIDRILMAPMPGNLDQLAFISEQLPVPLEKLDLATVFDFSSIKVLAEEANQSLYFTVLGAALRFTESSQQLNLQVKVESSSLLAVQAELATLGLIFLSLLGYWGLRQGEVSTAKMMEAASAQQLQTLKAKLQSQPASPELTAQIAALKPQAEAAQRILATTGNLGSMEGYTQHFALLASLAKEGVWLNNVTVEQAGLAVHLSGRALQKESVLRYSRQLNDLFADRGVQFTALELTSEIISRQGSRRAPLTTVAFKLY